MEGRLHLLAYQALDHQPTHGDVDPRLARFWQVFVILRESALPPEPTKRAFHDPAVRQDMEPAGQRWRLLPRRHPDVAHSRPPVLDHFDTPAKGGFHPVLELPLIGRVQPEMREARKPLLP